MHDHTPSRLEQSRISIYADPIPTFPEISDFPHRARRRAPAGIAFLVFLTCISAAGFFIVKHTPAAFTKHAELAAATSAPLPPGETEDLVRHLENAASNLIKASEEINRSQAWIWPQIDECGKSCRLFSSAASDLEQFQIKGGY